MSRDLEAQLGRKLYREERRALLRGVDILPRAKQISALQAKLGRPLHRDERLAVLHGENVLPSSVNGESWMAHPDEHVRGKFKLVQGGSVDSNRRRH